jgi:hypothetical protein
VLWDDNLLLGEALAPALTADSHQTAAITTPLAGGLAAIRAHRPDACLTGSAWPMPRNSRARGGVGGSEV